MPKFFFIVYLLLVQLPAYCQTGVFEEYILRHNENPLSEINHKTFLKAEISKTSCFVGEPVVITYTYYTRLNTEVNVTHYPSFNGFSVIELNEPETESVQVIHGVNYRAYILRKVQVYAMQAGTFEIEPLEADISAIFIKEDYYNKNHLTTVDLTAHAKDSYPSDAIVEQKTALKNAGIVITVKGLPGVEQARNFKGATGSFSIESALEEKQVATGGKSTLAVIVKGNGNLHLVNAPKISFPAGFEVFDQKTVEEFNTYAVPVSGRKIFLYPFVATDSGIFTIPPVEFCYFDLGLKAFKTISTKPVMVTVTGELKFDRAMEKGDNKTTGWLAGLFASRLLVIIILAFLILSGLFWWVRKDSKKEKTEKGFALAQQQAKMEQQRMEEAILHKNKSPVETALKYMSADTGIMFYRQLNKDFRNYLSGKFKIPVPEITRKQMAQVMEEAGCENETSREVQLILDLVEKNLYMPDEEEGNREILLDKINGVTEKLKDL
jgi:type II secretory pathway pseudopilin PulG